MDIERKLEKLPRTLEDYSYEYNKLFNSLHPDVQDDISAIINFS